MLVLPPSWYSFTCAVRRKAAAVTRLEKKLSLLQPSVYTFRHCSCIGTYTESEHQQSVKEIYMVVDLLCSFFISVKLYNSAHFCPDFCNHLGTWIVGKVSSKHGEFVIQDKNRSSAIKMYTWSYEPIKREKVNLCPGICVHFNFVCVCFFFSLCEACFIPQELIWVAYIYKPTTAQVQ